jgi:hypothetical protein
MLSVSFARDLRARDSSYRTTRSYTDAVGLLATSPISAAGNNVGHAPHDRGRLTVDGFAFTENGVLVCEV